MVNLDDLLDRYSMKPHEFVTALTNVAASFDKQYHCEDGFTVTYNEVKGRALYYFPGYLEKPLEANISPDQRDYFLKIEYWRPI